MEHTYTTWNIDFTLYSMDDLNELSFLLDKMGESSIAKDIDNYLHLEGYYDNK